MEIKNENLSYFLDPGDVFACWEPYSLATVLGSSVSVCLYDPVKKIAGMNVFALPETKEEKNSTNYGNHSIPKLIEMVLHLGARKKYLQAHIIGGAFSKEHSSKDVGKKNVEIARKILKKSNINIVNDDTGGIFGRKVVFTTISGEMMVYKSNSIREKDWYDDKSINN